MVKYACFYGHSNLVRFLVSRGADIYQENNWGQTAIHALQIFDRNHRKSSSQPIAEIIDALIHDASFDPFACSFLDTARTTCTLFNGLPYENIRMLFLTESYVSLERRYIFIAEHLLAIENDIVNGLESVDFLLTHYERLRNIKDSSCRWPYVETILQQLVGAWVTSTEQSRLSWEVKIFRALELTSDLFRTGSAGTVLDTVALMKGILVQHWLEILHKNGVDLEHYIRYEQSQHLGGTIMQLFTCCRIIHMQFSYAEDGSHATATISNVCNPRYEHLDSDYRCEDYIRREICISQMDPIFVGNNGRLLSPLPGSWTPSLKSNKDLRLVRRYAGDGWMYVENMWLTDQIWGEFTTWWAEDNDNESEEKREEEDEETDEGSSVKSGASGEENEVEEESAT